MRSHQLAQGQAKGGGSLGEQSQHVARPGQNDILLHLFDSFQMSGTRGESRRVGFICTNPQTSPASAWRAQQKR